MVRTTAPKTTECFGVYLGSPFQTPPFVAARAQLRAFLKNRRCSTVSIHTEQAALLKHRWIQRHLLPKLVQKQVDPENSPMTPRHTLLIRMPPNEFCGMRMCRFGFNNSTSYSPQPPVVQFLGVYS